MRLLESRGIAPAFAAGHSLGEYSAHVAAGTLSFADALRTVRRAGATCRRPCRSATGAMAAILGLDAAASRGLRPAARGGEVVAPANLNAPGQVVIAGHADAVARAGERAKARGAKRVDSARGERAVPLRADEAGRGAAGAGAARAAAIRAIPVVANVDAEPKRDAARRSRR